MIPMLVEVLCIEGCPHRKAALKVLERVLAEFTPDRAACGPVMERTIRTEREAVREHFVGSPTIRVNGADVDPVGAELAENVVGATGFGVQCRLYPGPGQPGVPAEDVVRRAVAAVLAKERRS